MSRKILFFGNERLATGVRTTAPALRGLIAHGYEVPAVIVAQSLGGKSRRERELEIAAVARQHNIPLLSPSDLTDAKHELASFGAEAAVLIAYGKIIPPAVLDLFPAGIINIHPSLLPAHRGSTPLESVILDDVRETGVSLMRLSEKMDAGPLYAQKIVALSDHETKQALADQLSAIGTDMLLQNLPAILDGSLEPGAQNEAGATYDHLITKPDGQIDWAKPATRLEREIRAYAGWPRSRAKLGNLDVIITQAHVGTGAGKPGELQIENQQLGIYTSENLIIIDSLIPLGKKEMPSAAFLAGYKTILEKS
jgi:methionyl-tRNA formyltransferase